MYSVMTRTLMTPAFHQRGVQQYFDVMLATTRAHLARWGIPAGRIPNSVIGGIVLSTPVYCEGVRA
jgi:hypothetical protein